MMNKKLFLFMGIMLLHRSLFAQNPFIDSTFGTNGLFITKGGLELALNNYPSIYLTNDQRIYIRHGQVFNQLDFLGSLGLGRLTPDGVPDPEFGNQGFIQLAAQIGLTSSYRTPIVQRPNGTILTGYTEFITGPNYYSKTILHQFTANGLPDSTFGTNGVVIITEPTQGGGAPNLQGICLQSNNNFVLVYGGLGFRYMYANGSQPANNEAYFWTFNTLAERIFKVISQPDNRILLGGNIYEINSQQAFTGDILLARFDPDGYVHESFGNQGFARYDLSGILDIIHDMQLLPDQKILVTGNASPFALFVGRFLSDGTPDTSFAPGGFRAYPQYSIGHFDTRLGQPRSDGKFIVAGTDTIGLHTFLLRFHSNGEVDSSFNGGQVVYLPVLPSGNKLTLTDLVQLPDHRILVCGSDPVTHETVIIRLLPDADAIPWYADQDGDGFGVDTPSFYAVTSPSGYVSQPGDCNDQSAAINPGQTELCNGYDDNCDGITDDIPVITCVNQLTVWLDETGHATIQPEQAYVNPSLPCIQTIVQLELDMTAFDCQHLGVNTVTLTGTNTLGGSNHCTFQVTVLDQAAPVVTCPPVLPLMLDDTGLLTLTPSLTGSNAADNCGVASYTFTPAQLSISNIGVNTVQFLAVDNSGNMAGCSINIILTGTSGTTIPEDLQGISLTPNPASDRARITLPTQLDFAELEITILNPDGKHIREIKTADFSVRDLPGGVYAVLIRKGGITRVLTLVKS